MKGTILIHVDETDGDVFVSTETQMDLTDPAAAVLAAAILGGVKQGVMSIDNTATLTELPR